MAAQPRNGPAKLTSPTPEHLFPATPHGGGIELGPGQEGQQHRPRAGDEDQPRLLAAERLRAEVPGGHRARRDAHADLHQGARDLEPAAQKRGEERQRAPQGCGRKCLFHEFLRAPGRARPLRSGLSLAGRPAISYGQSPAGVIGHGRSWRLSANSTAVRNRGPIPCFRHVFNRGGALRAAYRLARILGHPEGGGVRRHRHLSPRTRAPGRRGRSNPSRAFTHRTVAPANRGARSFSSKGTHPMTCIVSIHAREILDSRGNPTVEVDARLSDGRR